MERAKNVKIIYSKQLLSTQAEVLYIKVIMDLIKLTKIHVQNFYYDLCSFIYLLSFQSI